MQRQAILPEIRRRALIGLGVVLCWGMVNPGFSQNVDQDQNDQQRTHAAPLLEGHLGAEGPMRLSRPAGEPPLAPPRNGGQSFLRGAESNLQSSVNGADFAGSVRSNAPAPMNPPATFNASANFNAPTYGGLTTVELHRLTSHDVVLLIDRSGSMGTHDCPAPDSAALQGWKGALASFATGGLLGGGCSRWDWCAAQATSLGRVMSLEAPKGLSVLLFSSQFHIFPRVTWNEIPGIFNDNRPGGGTELGEPLRAALDDYLQRKAQTGGHIRPLAIGIITDGCPSDKDFVAREIVQATKKIQDPREISITFFQIGGRDPEGEEFIWNLDNNLGRAGARFDIVRGVPFNQLVQQGLPKALAGSLE